MSSGSTMRVGGVLLAFVGLIGVGLGSAAIYIGRAESMALPMAFAAIGLGLLVLGVRLVASGERKGQLVGRAEADIAAKSNLSPVVAVGAVILLAAWTWYYFGGGLEQQAARTMQDIENKVAADAVIQYGIAKRNGTKIDACVHAGMVAAAWLQANNEGQYQQWKQTEKADCAAAGVPR